VPKRTDKPSSVPWRTRVAVIYLVRRLPAASSGLPGGPGRRAASRRLAPSPCLALLPVGFAQPTPSLESLVVSYTTVSPSLAEASSLLSVALFRRVTPPGCYPAPCSTELGLSSDGVAPSATAWPAWAPIINITQTGVNVNPLSVSQVPGTFTPQKGL
jgi:hypothetical protein